MRQTPERQPPTEDERPLLRVRDLRVHWRLSGPLGRGAGTIRAVDGVSFDLERGATLGLVGESACGKTSVARAILGLVPAASGAVMFDGVNILALRGAERRRWRRRMQMVFQDPTGSLDPRMTAGRIVAEGLRIHRLVAGRAVPARVGALLETVGLRPSQAAWYPHQFSSGQRQRIGIARALALDPQLLVCDEPVSSLDVSVQAQILNLLADLQTRMGLSYLFIAHDLAVVRRVSDAVAVMYLGRIVEQGPADAIYARPRHPYTHALLASVPRLDPAARVKRTCLVGEVPSALDPPRGCAFHPRCPLATDRCRAETPGLESIDDAAGRHRVACHRSAETADGVFRTGTTAL